MKSNDTPLNLLLVDDRVENLHVYEAVLSSPQYRLVQVSSGAEAVEAVAQQDFVVILLDIQMPVMDGFETAKLIRGMARGKDVPIVFVTALDRDSKYTKQGYQLGAVDFVFKPFEPLALRAKINLLAELYQKNVETQRLAKELEKQAKTARESEARFRFMIQSVKDYAIFMLDPQGYVVTWNEGAQRLKGYEVSEIIGKHFSVFYEQVDLDAKKPELELREAISKGRFEDEGWRLRKDGSRFWANVIITATYDDHEKLIGFSKVTRDLTERKRVEEELRKTRDALEIRVSERTTELARNEEFLTRMIEGSSDCIKVLDLDGRLRFMNSGGIDVFEVQNLDSVLGSNWLSYWEGQHLQLARLAIVEAKKGGVGRFIGFCPTAKGKPKWWDVVVSGIGGPDGKPEKLLAVSRDVTEQKRIEEEKNLLLSREQKARKRAQESEDQLRSFADSIPQLAWMADPDGSIFWYNQRWYTYTGTLPGQMLGWGWQSVHDPKELPRVLDQWQEAIRLGKALELEFPLKSAEGQFRWFLTRVTPVRNSEGEVVRWFGTNTDIEDARRARLALKDSTKSLELAVEARTQELQVSRAFLDSVIENIPNMIFVKSAKDLRFVRFNKAGEDLLGYSREELIGKNDYDFFPREQADFFTSKDRAVLSESRMTDIPEEVIETRHKGTRILHTRKIPLYGHDGTLNYLLGISEDITEWKRAEAERAKMISDQAALEERERAAQRTTFLAEASTLLSSSLDYRDTLGKLARLSVPVLADWCTITIVKEDHSKERVAIVHRDPDKTSVIDEFTKYSSESVDEAVGIASVIHSGKSMLGRRKANDESQVQIMRDLGCSSCMIVPIVIREKVLGAIAFVSNQESRLYAEEDLVLGEELARRAAVAIENALLYEAAQKAIRTRDEFLSIASHELKTPITSLKLQLQITRRNTRPELNMGPTPEKLAKVLDVSSVQVGRLTRLIDDLLDVTRIQAGKLSFHFEPVDISVLVKDMVDRYGEHLSSVGCEVRVDASTPVMISGDRFRLEQVILNILSNAAKYGAGKPVEISVREADSRVRVSCRDHGIGIASDKVDKVFERYERAVGNANISGLGLGLYIAREIVVAHHGNIQVESVLGEGSVFTIELPTEQAQAPTGLAVEKEQLDGKTGRLSEVKL